MKRREYNGSRTKYGAARTMMYVVDSLVRTRARTRTRSYGEPGANCSGTKQRDATLIRDCAAF
jgi:hypothetical protein